MSLWPTDRLTQVDQTLFQRHVCTYDKYGEETIVVIYAELCREAADQTSTVGDSHELWKARARRRAQIGRKHGREASNQASAATSRRYDSAQLPVRASFPVRSGVVANIWSEK